MLDKIGIGITTKDRWEELALTLEKLEKYGLGANETIVMDDGSQQLAPASLRARFPRVRFERSEQSRFVAPQRNRLAQLLSTPYFLQVDDDSFPVQGDLAEAASWLESQKDALALAFIVTELDDYSARLRMIPTDPFPCHYFVGCAALIKREVCLGLGGYEEALQSYCEEIGIALRARAHDLFVYQYAGVVVHHNRSPVARFHAKRSYLIARNELTLAILYYPLLFALIRWPTFILRELIVNRRPPTPPLPRWGILQGSLAAVKLIPRMWARREALTMASFLTWKRSPAPITIR